MFSDRFVSFSFVDKLFTKLSSVVAQDQKYEALNNSQTH